MFDIEALEGETMNSFFKLIPSDQTQSEPACCGFASLVMVLNALAVDPGRTWKGIRYGKAACLAHCNGAKAESFRTNEITDVVSDWKWAFLTLTITKTRMFWFLIYQGSVNGIRSLVTQENMIDTLSVCW
uniref:glutathione gamma-glutamylcysteinyltransferase n=1 Tax=Populus trichocarpa TaxID=3694 RepID=B9GRX7_POPTR